MNNLALKIYRPKKAAAKGFWQTLGIPARGAKLHQLLNDGVSYNVYKRLAKIAGIEQQELARYARISPASLGRRAQAGQFTPAESDRLYRFAEVFNAACELFEGDTETTRRWMLEPVTGLGGRRPVEMLGTTAECESILDLVGRLEHGVLV